MITRITITTTLKKETLRSLEAMKIKNRAAWIEEAIAEKMEREKAKKSA
jgi:hypothetical protein